VCVSRGSRRGGSASIRDHPERALIFPGAEPPLRRPRGGCAPWSLCKHGELGRRVSGRTRRLAIVVSGALALAWLLALAGFSPGDRQPAAAQPPHVHDRMPPQVEPARPPQFVVVSFDGSGGDRLWPHWRSVARRAHARFTFFVSGVYLLDE